MRKKLVLFLSLTICLCASSVSIEKDKISYFSHLFSGASESEIPKPDQLMGNIIDQTVNEIKQEYDLFPIGVGMGGKFRSVSISFYIYRSLEKNEARIIVLDCAEKFLKNIQSSKEIQPYLEIQPFTLENIGITIYSVDEKYDHFPHPYIAVADIDDEGLIFRTEDPGDEFGYKETTKETFEEARAKIAECKSKRD